MRPRTASPGGFTLLEIMIVVGMAALVFAISIPFVERTIRRDEVYRAVHVVEDACHNARATAIFNNAPADLVIHPDDGAFSVAASTRAGGLLAAPSRTSDSSDSETEGGPSPAPIRDFSRHAPKPFSGRLGDDVTIELLDINFTEHRDEEQARVRFHPNGTCDEFTIVMRIGTAVYRKVTLDIVTGTPSVEVMR